MVVRISAWVVWSLAAAAAVFWGLRLFVAPTPVPERAQAVGMAPPLAGDLTRLLGAAPVNTPTAAPPPPDAATRFRLTGVVATRTARDPGGPAAPGLALISVDGKPSQAYRVGDALDDQFGLASVGLRSARIDARGGGGGFVLELPPPAPAATGLPVGYNPEPQMNAMSPMRPQMQSMPPQAQPMPPGIEGQDPNGVILPAAPLSPQGQMLPLGPPQAPGGMLGGNMDPNGRNRNMTQ